MGISEIVLKARAMPSWLVAWLQSDVSATSIKKNPFLIYEWHAINQDGERVRDKIFAREWPRTNKLLVAQGFTNIRVAKRRAAPSTRNVSVQEVAIFSRQLALMQRAGVPMGDSLSIIASGTSSLAFKRLVMELYFSVQSGEQLSDACANYPRIFDNLFCALIRAGEASGTLDTLLDRLATYKEKTQQVRDKVKKALYYPAAVIVAAFIVTTLIMLFVIPSFKQLFASFGAELPLATQIVVKLSEWFVQYWWLIFGGIFGLGWGFMTAMRQSTVVHDLVDRMALKLPVLGEVITLAIEARWTRTLSTVLAAGTTIVDGLETVADVAGNRVFYDHTKMIRREVMTGTALNQAMTMSGLFPSMVIQMVAIGEESGELEKMLAKVAEYFEQDVDNAVDSLTSLMQPIIMAVLGTVVGALVIALYLPIFKLGQVV